MIRPLVAVAIGSGLVLPGHATAAPSLCNSVEEVQFSCVIESNRKIASVCSSPDLRQGPGYLQYRFGKPEALEMEFPKDKKLSAEQFRLDPRHHLDVDTVELSFVQGKFRYSVFVAQDQDGTRASIEVSREGGKEVVLHCKPGAQSRLASLVAAVPLGSGE